MTVKYLALGDSYTIGTGASSEKLNFPARLQGRLEAEAGKPVQLKNPAVNGYTSADLIRHELTEVGRFRPELVTVLIGANDIVQGLSEEGYRTRLGQIYDTVAGLRLPGGSVVALSVPDFSTHPGSRPFGSPALLRSRIDAFNRVAAAEAVARHFDFIDLSNVSRSGLGSDGWLAADGLHPGDQQYESWAGFIWEAAGPRWLELVAG